MTEPPEPPALFGNDPADEATAISDTKPTEDGAPHTAEATDAKSGGANEDEEDEDDDEEPRLKYTRLTRSLGTVYRNGDSVSCSLVFGERMVVGTHNGNIHILSLPSLSPIRTYKAHGASVSSISISPPPPPPGSLQTHHQRKTYHDRHISIATSSLDGLVCIVPMLPAQTPQPGQTLATIPYNKAEIAVKNFKRPIEAVALSPNFRVDRVFLTGGKAGNLVHSTAATGGTQSWLGLGGNKDIVLHSGEGTISAIAWSKESPRYVAWTNEQGIKIMRSHIVPPSSQKPGKEEATENPGMIGWIPGLGGGGRPAGEVSWKRISAIERPDSIPEEMATVHRPRLEWIDRRTLMTSEPRDEAGGSLNVQEVDWSDKEKLVVGWSGTVWVIDVFAGSGEKDQEFGWAQITHIFQNDCIISGIHMYTPSLLILLAYIPAPEEEGSPAPSGSSQAGPRGIRHRQKALVPELRFIDVDSSEEVSADELMMSRYEALSVGDYHLGVLPAIPAIVQPTESESGGMMANLWSAAINPTQLFTGAQSVRSYGSSSRPQSTIASTIGTIRTDKATATHWTGAERGTKIYITSPYDVVFATERSPRDHLIWLLDRERYAEAYDLIERIPAVVDDDTETASMYDEEQRKELSPDDDESDSESSSRKASVQKYSVAEQEKRRVGEKWLTQLMDAGDFTTAGEVAGKVLGTSSRWEHWVWMFKGAKQIEQITYHLPRIHLQPPLPTTIYDVVLAHYLARDKHKFRELLLETWKPEGSRTLYDARAIVDVILDLLEKHHLKPTDQDWIDLQYSLANMYLVLGEYQNALKHFVLVKDAEEAFCLIRQYRLVDAVSEDIASIVLLRVDDKLIREADLPDLENAASQALDLLVEEADKGIIAPNKVVEQLRNESVSLGDIFLFFYLRRLWKPESHESHTLRSSSNLGGGILAEYGDLMVELFSEYDRPLMMQFLKESHTYSLEKASLICERRQYIPELVHLLSKTGQTKRALFLIIDKLGDVQQAIEFAKQQDDPDLWEDLLNYSMDKPPFIRGLLENVGTAIDPITLMKRIPQGLEIPGVKKSIRKILKEYGVQWSICDGVAQAMRGEVSRGMDQLRRGQRRGVRVNVADPKMPGAFPDAAAGGVAFGGEMGLDKLHNADTCGICRLQFYGHDRTTLVAFACTHVYHLRCLTGNEEEQSHDQDGMMGAGNYRSVSIKVTRAAMLRNAINARGGCVVCKEAKKDEIMV